jgi:hypothetical protein
MMAPPRRCQSINCPYPRAGTGVRVRSTLERCGARSREACTLERGGACSRGPLTGPPRWAAGATAAWAVPVCALKQDVFSFGFLQVLSGISPVVLGASGLSRHFDTSLYRHVVLQR